MTEGKQPNVCTAVVDGNTQVHIFQTYENVVDIRETTEILLNRGPGLSSSMLGSLTQISW